MKKRIAGLAAILALPSCGPVTPEDLCSGEDTRAQMEALVHTTEVMAKRRANQNVVKRVELDLKEPAVMAFDPNTKIASCAATVTLKVPDGYLIKDQERNYGTSLSERQPYSVQPAADGSGLILDWRYYGMSNLMAGLAGIMTVPEAEDQKRLEAEQARKTAARLAEERRSSDEARAKYEIVRARLAEEIRQGQERLAAELQGQRQFGLEQQRRNAAFRECNESRQQTYDAAGGGVAGSRAVQALPRCQ